jgi:hypothetical protein
VLIMQYDVHGPNLGTLRQRLQTSDKDLASTVRLGAILWTDPASPLEGVRTVKAKGFDFVDIPADSPALANRIRLAKQLGLGVGVFDVSVQDQARVNRLEQASVDWVTLNVPSNGH